MVSLSAFGMFKLFFLLLYGFQYGFIYALLSIITMTSSITRASQKHTMPIFSNLSVFDETVRIVAFVAACKGVDLRKMLRLTLWLTLAGTVILFALSGFGIFGDFKITASRSLTKYDTNATAPKKRMHSHSSREYFVAAILIQQRRNVIR